MYAIQKLTKGYAVVNNESEVQSTYENIEQAEAAILKYIEEDNG